MRDVLIIHLLLVALVIGGCSTAPDRDGVGNTLPPEFVISPALRSSKEEDATSILKVKLSDCPPENRLIFDADSNLVFCRFDHPGDWRLTEYGGNPYFVKPD